VYQHRWVLKSEGQGVTRSPCKVASPFATQLVCLRPDRHLSHSHVSLENVLKHRKVVVASKIWHEEKSDN
jgi:hypothetical protein